LPVTVTVSSLPTVSSFTVTSASVDTGSTVTFQVVASGGTGSLTYAYSNLPNGCASVDADSLQCTPNATGTYTVKVTVTDSVGGSTSATVALSVSQPNGGGILGGGSSSSGDLILVVVLVVVLVVIGIVVAVVLMRRKKGKPYPTQPQTPPNTYSQPWPQGYSPPPQGPIPPPPPY
jgi:cobalamin biosynthesis Mg chelatase CobN